MKLCKMKLHFSTGSTTSILSMVSSVGVGGDALVVKLLVNII